MMLPHFNSQLTKKLDASRNVLKPDHLNIIANKTCFLLIDCMVLDNEEDAAKTCAYLSTENARPMFIVALVHIRSQLSDCIRETTEDRIYVGLSSKELLDGICKLTGANTLKYQ